MKRSQFFAVLGAGLALGGVLGFSLADRQQVSAASPAYDWVMAQITRKSPAVDLAKAREGTDSACLFGLYTDADRMAKLAGLSLPQAWALRRMADVDSHGVLLFNKGAVTDAFLLRSDALAGTDVAAIEGHCGSSLVLHRQDQELPRTVVPKGAVSGARQQINWALTVNTDCSSGEMPSIIISAKPEHGRVFVEQGSHYPDFAKNNIRWRCNFKDMPALLVYYQSEPGYVGPDRVGVDVVFPDGKVTLWDHPVTVR